MKELKIKTYSFDELSDTAKQKALEISREDNVGYYWTQVVEWDWQDKLEALGYYDIGILYSGFWSQGDGACFTAKINIAKWLKAHKLENKYRLVFSNTENITATLTHCAHYYHSTTTNLSIEDNLHLASKKWDTQLNEIDELILKEREEMGNKIYKDLESEYEYITSDDAVSEMLIENEYQFTIDGERKVYI
jgi:hypothetical protein